MNNVVDCLNDRLDLKVDYLLVETLTNTILSRSGTVAYDSAKTLKASIDTITVNLSLIGNLNNSQ